MRFRPHRHWQALLVAVVGSAAILWWLSSATPLPQAPGKSGANRVVQKPPPDPRERPEASAPKPTPAPPKPAAPPAVAAVVPDDAHLHAEFREWLDAYLALKGAAADAALMERGARLAAERKRRMARLIATDPEQAMREALNFAEYAALPEAVRALVEKPFSEQAEYSYLPVCAPPGGVLPPGVPDHLSDLTLRDGTRLKAFAYGQRAAVTSKRNLPVQGIMLDGAAAMHDSVFRELAQAEVPVVANLYPAGQADLGRSFATGKPISGTPVVAVAGGRRFAFADHEELQRTNDRLAKLDELPGPNAGSAAIFEQLEADAFLNLDAAEELAQEQASTWTETVKRVFLIRIDFSDNTGAAYTQTQVSNSVNTSVSNQISAMSYGKTSIQATVSANTYRVPQTALYYSGTDDPNYGTSGYSSLNSDLLRDGRNTFRNDKSGADASIDIGPVSNTGNGDSGGLGNYDIVGVVFKGIGMIGGGVHYAGLGGIGAGRLWIQGTNSAVVYTHEFGHNYGLGHANFWQTSDGSVAGAGANVEYGDSYDIMGGGSVSSGHFHPQAKSKLNWLTTSQWADATALGANTYRIYRCDDANTTGTPRGVRVTKAGSPSEYYWIGYRPAQSGSNFQTGAYLIWQRPNTTQCWLLDTTPETSGVKSDSPIAMGTTYSDTDTPVFITPIATGGTGSERYIDVYVAFNAAGNHAPDVSPIAGPSTVKARTLATFTSSATDQDGDTLLTEWDAGDGTGKSSGNSMTHTWAVGGTYDVTFTVNDLKGGKVTVTKTVTVTDPSRTWTASLSGVTENLTSVASNGTTVVAVGDAGRILVSLDGNGWGPQSLQYPLDYAISFQAITWDGTRYIAVGEEYDFDLSRWIGVIYTSPEGYGWARGNLPYPTDRLFGVASSGGVAVAVGDSATVLRSTDGQNWSAVALAGVGSTESLRGAAYGGGTFVISGITSNGVKVLTSTNGTAWTDQSAGSGLAYWEYMSAIARLSDKFVGSGWYSQVRTSTDGGLSFTTTRPGTEETPALAYGDGVYFAGGVDRDNSSADVDLLSVDGVNWYSFAAPTTTYRNGAAFFKHRIITVGDSGEIWRSGDLSAAPAILSQPTGSVVLKGTAVQFSIVVSGSDPLTYRWRRNGVNISGATSATYTIPSVLASQAGSYDCVVSNGVGAVTSKAAVLVVNSPAEVVTHPVATSVKVGGTTTLNITASGDQPIYYQWEKDGLAIPGANSSSLELAGVQVDARGDYDCVVSNLYGEATSNTAYLNVLDKFVMLGAATFTVDEDVAGGILNVPILRTGSAAGDVSVTVTATNGTATTPSDYLPPAAVATIPDGEDHVDVPITIQNPINTPEANETFKITLSSPPPGTGLDDPASATIVIVDTSSYSPALDTAVPGVPAFTYPAANAKVGVNTAATLVVTGTASDNKGVKQVQVSANGGGFADATLGTPGATSTTFSFPFVPATGLNTVQVKSTDYAGRVSAVVTRSFTVMRPLNVAADASLGSVTVGFSPTSFREVGKSYTITATPKAPTPGTTPPFDGGLFTGWKLRGIDEAKSGTPALTDADAARIGTAVSSLAKQTLTFIFREGMTLEAVFVDNPYTAGVVGTYNGLVKPSATLPDRGAAGPSAEDGTATSTATEGYFTATVQNTGAFSAKLTIDGFVLSFAGAFDEKGQARFGTVRALTQTVARPGKPSVIVKFDIGGPVDSVVSPGKIAGQVTATEFKKSVVAAVSMVEADRAHYTGLTSGLTVPDPYLTVSGTAAPPAGRTDGLFTVILPRVALASQPLRIQEAFTEMDYPQGSGVGTLKVSKSGTVTFTGSLADGTSVTATSALSQDLRASLFAQLYSLRGFFSTQVKLDSAQSESDLAPASGAETVWSRPFQSTSHYYPYGWPEVIALDLKGAKYLVTAGQSVMRAPDGADGDDFGDLLQAVDADGNVELHFSEGQLSEELVKYANLSTGDVLTKAPDNDPTFTATVTRSSGAISGTVTHTDDTVPTYKAVIYQKGPDAGAYGFFLTKQPTPITYTGESGQVLIIGQP